MKYLILGNGWIGNILKNYFGDEAMLYSDWLHSSFIFSHNFPEYGVMINTIAKTNIDWCEKNKFKALETNALLAKELSEKCKNNNTKYVFFSSACIFESKNQKDIKYEDSIPNPQCWYSWTKATAEQLILEINPDTLIIRPRLPISEVYHPRNTLNKLLNYDKINTNQESVTVIEDMLPMLKQLIEENAKGIYHLVNGGIISPAEIADLLNHPHKKVTKKSQDERLAEEERAKRVTTYVGSRKIPLLPDIQKRIIPLIKKFNETRN